MAKLAHLPAQLLPDENREAPPLQQRLCWRAQQNCQFATAAPAHMTSLLRSLTDVMLMLKASL